ncbi:hypothetical protein ABW99_16855 [Pandoraea thiooxydans]|uniref:Protein NO VEIN C-terminal domain-containing protein n=1 Tax=Pandoraea thiooxydans TaxID=445709 RepID=A0A0G3ERC8_9BURK|nr:DUF3883 domain-containing protein [Pandoraea thiooxydans]AKJ69628.1 hypothetical protein ABW99_16855 [Pandoraea thiooxydans]
MQFAILARQSVPIGWTECPRVTYRAGILVAIALPGLNDGQAACLSIAAGLDPFYDLVKGNQGAINGLFRYEIEAYDSEARPLYIEVKTTNGGIAAPFLVTANEVAVSKEEADHYAIYRVFDFAKEPKVYVLKGPVDVSCELTPHLWLAFPK